MPADSSKSKTLDNHTQNQPCLSDRHPWLTLMRISNLPTIWSHVWAGLCLGQWSDHQKQVSTLESISTHPEHLISANEMASWVELSFSGFLVFVAMSLIYLGGMIQNDVFDTQYDQTHQIKRPIAIGQIQRSKAATISSLMLLGGIYFTFNYAQPLVGIYTIGLVLSVLIYNWRHKKNALSIIFMGICRGLVVIIAAEVFHPDSQHLSWVDLWPPASILWLAAIQTLSVIGITAYARHEHSKPQIKRHIPTMLACLCLTDAVFLLLIRRFDVALMCLLCFVLTLVFQRKIKGT